MTDDEDNLFFDLLVSLFVLDDEPANNVFRFVLLLTVLGALTWILIQYA